MVCIGPAETGNLKATLTLTSKITATRHCTCSVSSTAELQSSALYVKGSNAFFLERAAISSLLFAIDDPPMTKSGSSTLDVYDLMADLYNGSKTGKLRCG